ncbi:MAG: hypothetical protein MUC97_13945 [Bernardetiaceae bacterium]|nr:hypothetical protein [Bernardetiaceae bacterium]
MTPLEFFRRVYRKLSTWSQPAEPSRYGQQPILDLAPGNELIAQGLASGRPFMVARFGTAELNCVRNYLQMNELASVPPGLGRYWRRIKGHEPTWQASVRQGITNNAGFFPPTDTLLARFAQAFIAHLAQVDVLGVWHQAGEGETVQQLLPQAQLVKLRCLEPYYHAQPWSRVLAGKKVLVVHPFEDSIRQQMQKRALLFADPLVLPPFELRTVRAVQSIAGNATGYPDWFAAYDDMCQRIAATDFDVAIIGAGAYGLPLASFVKQLGKQAVHLGGATQILFGIKGKRWDDHPPIAALYNAHWQRPLPSEVPQAHTRVEDGCYW